MNTLNCFSPRDPQNINEVDEILSSRREEVFSDSVALKGMFGWEEDILFRKEEKFKAVLFERYWSTCVP